MSYISAEILNSDKKGVNDHKSDAKMKNEKKQFGTAAMTESLIEAAPKKQSKPTVQKGFDALANDNRQFA